MKQSFSSGCGPEEARSLLIYPLVSLARIQLGGSCILASPEKAPQNCHYGPQVAVFRSIAACAINRAVDRGLGPGRAAPRKLGSSSGKGKAYRTEMTRKYLLEVSVDGVEKATAAERGGASRIELCGDLSVGGLTPSRELLRRVRAQVHIPVYSMIRPRAGDFVYSSAEFEEMERSIGVATECGMDGVVLGILRKGFKVDVGRTRRLVDLARPLPVTFHRAFDECADLREALEKVIQTGAARILTSAGAKTALQGSAKLAELVAAARDRILILPGAGITHSNVASVRERTGALEFHSGLGTVLPYSSRDYHAFEVQVGKLAEQLAGQH